MKSWIISGAVLALGLGQVSARSVDVGETGISGSFESSRERSRASGQHAIGLGREDAQQRLQDLLPRQGTLQNLLDAVDIMQSSYWQLWTGTWPTSIDWTAAVLSTHLSATLSSLSSAMHYTLASQGGDGRISNQCPQPDALSFENIINRYFSDISAFYFGENAFALRNEAYDDMLWVALEWLELIKFVNLHSALHYPSTSASAAFYGVQFKQPAAHRARIFYDIAHHGWDTSLCGGGMIWNPSLVPYKNAITNELYISASIGMYLYFPGDKINSPFIIDSTTTYQPSTKPHDPAHLHAAVEAYDWLKNSNMTNANGLYCDGFHISGWQVNPNGTINPGTRKCDVLNTMVYTYNQGVLLSGLRGLYLATQNETYLQDAHSLILSTIEATGWKHHDNRWRGLGRNGVLEESCDASGTCSQDGQTFKGIFFHHFAELCRELRPEEVQFLHRGRQARDHDRDYVAGEEDDTWNWHLRQCRTYFPWIELNARAALATRDENGKFGMWWGWHWRSSLSSLSSSLLEKVVTVISGTKETEWEQDIEREEERIPTDAVDWRNHPHPRLDDGEKGSGNGITVTDPNSRGRGRTVETQSGGIAVLRALWQWEVQFRN